MNTKLSFFDKIMTAVTFAEAGEHAEAKRFLTDKNHRPARKGKCKKCETALSADLHGAEAHS
jgi:hypothetical protein